MKVTIHRGTHQIGGIATEISTDATRIIIDMGDELSLDPEFISTPLQISGVTDAYGNCNAVFFTHYHGDHIGQMTRIRKDIPLYAGALAKDIMLMSAERKRPRDDAFCDRIQTIHSFVGGETIVIGDIRITPWSIDHSACDSYLFLVEADGKRLLYSGDFRMHGFRGHALPKILHRVGKVDALIIEGTTLSRPDVKPMTEYELQQKVKDYLVKYKYVFVLCASTNLERICALSKAVPRGKYFVCDRYQANLLDLVEQHWGHYSELYRNLKKTVYGDNLVEGMRQKGFLMCVRDNREFRRIISQFDPQQSIMLYSMWEGYRTKAESSIPEFLDRAGCWATLHTSGHASHSDIRRMIDIVSPEVIIPMHTDDPNLLHSVCPEARVTILNDREEISI